MMSDALKTDLDEALHFINWAHPGGPWVLTAIPVEGGRTTTATFFDLGAAKGWLAEYSGKQNIYWTVNRVRGATDKKPKKEDIEEAVMLHVDLDPRKGEDVAKEQARILRLLEEFSPSPSAIIYSGGGYQAFWRLDEPMYIGGTPERWVDVEACNRQLGIVLGGDATWNVDRIMRLPGTINLPDEKKRKKGRVMALAAVHKIGGQTYPLRDFTPTPEQKASGNGTIEFADLPRVALNDLPATVSERTRMLIVHGDDPDDPDRYSSKSEAMWAVTCDMVRAGCTDVQIAAVLLDPGYGVSDHPLRQKRSEDYAARQIERAREDNDAGGRRVLDANDPYRTALRLKDELFADAIHTNGDWLNWSEGAYRAVEDATVTSILLRELDAAVVRVKRDNSFAFDRFKPSKKKVDEIVGGLRGIAHQPVNTVNPPVWLDGPGPPPDEIVACANGLLHVPTGELHPPTPRFFTRNALDIAFDPAAPEPLEFLTFVSEVFPDAEAAALLQDWLGYLLLPDTSHQKILLMVGPPRSGKGVTQQIITKLVGEGNTCNPRSGSLGGSNVGALQPLIGKTVAFMSDARFGRPPNGQAATETLLTVSGGDNVTIDRKFKDAWTGRLATRLVILSNELPSLRDNSPALANRFTPLLFEQSFLGREDLGLAQRIISGELPGILNWALDGWRRLRERGRFALPKASMRAITEILELGSPVATFIHDRCQMGADKLVDKQSLYRAYKAWCGENEHNAGAANVFGRDLMTATNRAVKETRMRDGRGGEGKIAVYRGIALDDCDNGPTQMGFGSADDPY